MFFPGLLGSSLGLYDAVVADVRGWMTLGRVVYDRVWEGKAACGSISPELKLLNFLKADIVLFEIKQIPVLSLIQHHHDSMQPMSPKTV